MICSRQEAVHRGAAVLATAGIEQPHREARLLLQHLLGLSREALLLDPDAPVDLAAFAAQLARRAAREPLAFITGEREFWSLRFAVSPATLIPRPDTETLLEAALARIDQPAQVGSVLDLGTGTGCLLLAALTEFRAAFGVGVDRSPDAAALAARNATVLGLADRAAFLAGNWEAALAGRFDLILCNPPYIDTATIPSLAPEVAQHEPRGALDGGRDGLDAYRAILPDLPRLLAVGGLAVCELGIGMAADVTRLAIGAGLATEAVADLAGIPRALVLRIAGTRKNRLAGQCGRD